MASPKEPADNEISEPHIINLTADDFTLGSSEGTVWERDYSDLSSLPVSLKQEVGSVAERYSETLGHHMNALKPEVGSKIDPASPDFDAQVWVRAFVKLAESDPNSAPSRSLGVAFQNLDVYGWGTGGVERQKNIFDAPLDILSAMGSMFWGNKRKTEIEILRDFEGIIEKGELLLVLGPPGAGCSTFLKTIAGETNDLEIGPDAYMNYRGVSTKDVRRRFRGDVLYNAEVDTHIPCLTVNETLTFAARANSVRHVPGGVTRSQADTMIKDVMMAIFGLSHTADTRVGDNFIRGVSGGERKRVSIAEAGLTGAKLQCWDNTTRGLDSGNAINFCNALRLQADYLGVAGAVAIYQAPQSAYDIFDRVTVLYQGRQIFFGKAGAARRYFEELGFECPERQTTADFLTSMTSPQERQIKPGYEHKVPRTPDEFAQRWKCSDQRKELLEELDQYEQNHPSGIRQAEYEESRREEKSFSQRDKSPYTISYAEQVHITLWRGWRRMRADPGFTLAGFSFQLVMSLVLGSLFYNLEQDASSFYYRGGIIFFALLFNAFSSQLEILTMYAERPVVEKHRRYAFYHQSAQALSGFLIELPCKILNMLTLNLIVYVMSNLRRDAGSFFFFCLTTFLSTLIMSCMYRILACITRTSHQAMVPASILSLALVTYTGFTIPTDYMTGWLRWIGYINPLAYAFEALMVNEFHSREFSCSQRVPSGPGYDSLPGDSQICPAVGAEAGSFIVNGDNYLRESFGYSNAHKWRNVGIMFGYLVVLFALYILSAEYAKPPKTKGEVLVFKKGATPPTRVTDIEAQFGRPVVVEKSGNESGKSRLAAGGSVFHWEDLCYDIQIKGKDRRLLDHIDGWVKPGMSTALMGVSGAGKTTLLDVLATRVTMGVVSGDTSIDGILTDSSFQNRVGYVQQQDLHLNTMTVREALEFSALLRQPAEISKEEKLEYVEQVVKMLEMEEFLDAVIGVQGEGLNVEQRKRLTIGVELAARPQLLLFLDEPTSGLDSQTSWAICDLIEKLTASGQAVLCTIHQPSAMLFQRFDRLLLLAPGGKTVYFGDLGEGSKTLLDYFERNGAPPCPPSANPAEYMLQTIQSSQAEAGRRIDWHAVWRNSPEYHSVKREIERLNALPVTQPVSQGLAAMGSRSQHQEFVTSFFTQLWQVLIRTWKYFWRTPNYIWSKIILIGLSSLFLGLSFEAKNSMQGLQNQLFAIFMYMIIFMNITSQITPNFVPQRDLYEVRERPSKTYRWTTLLLSNIIVEIIWNTLMAVLAYVLWYYPVGFVKNTSPADEHTRGFLVFLFLWTFLLLASTLSHFAISWIEMPDVASILMSFIWLMSITFCGLSVRQEDIPAFWKFVHRANPATYLLEGVMSVALYGSDVTCADNEILHMQAPGKMTCGEFLGPYIKNAGGVVLNPRSMETCSYCPLSSTNEFLEGFQLSYGNRWRDFGIMWGFISFNILAAFALYWLFRVPRGTGVKRN